MESTLKEAPMEDPEPSRTIDFTDTEIAFSTKSDKELKKMSQLFGLMNKNALVNIGSKLGLIAFQIKITICGLHRKEYYIPTILRWRKSNGLSKSN